MVFANYYVLVGPAIFPYTYFFYDGVVEILLCVVFRVDVGIWFFLLLYLYFRASPSAFLFSATLALHALSKSFGCFSLGSTWLLRSVVSPISLSLQGQ